MLTDKIENTGKQTFTLPIDINDKNAYSITSYNSKTVNATYFLFDDNYACFVENNTITKQWVVLKIFYDSDGGEIVTSQGDTICISKEILIKQAVGEQITLEYEPINIDKIGVR